MPQARSSASALLNQGEMELYDDSRESALRNFDGKELHARIKRAREARDRARDLVQRQAVATQERTGSRLGLSGNANERSGEKAELLADILKRFEERAAQLEPAQGGREAVGGETGAD